MQRGQNSVCQHILVIVITFLKLYILEEKYSFVASLLFTVYLIYICSFKTHVYYLS